MGRTAKGVGAGLGVLAALAILCLTSGETQVDSVDLSTGHTFTYRQTVIFGVVVHTAISSRELGLWEGSEAHPIRQPVLSGGPVYAFLSTTRVGLLGDRKFLCGFDVSRAYARIREILADAELRGDRSTEQVMCDVFMEHRARLTVSDQPFRDGHRKSDDAQRLSLLSRLRPPPSP